MNGELDLEKGNEGYEKFVLAHVFGLMKKWKAGVNFPYVAGREGNKVKNYTKSRGEACII